MAIISNIKIIHATNYYYPYMGGLTISVDAINSRLIEKGYDSVVYPFSCHFRRIENLIKNDIFHQAVHRLFVVLYITYGLLIVFLNKISMKKVIVHGHSANFCAILAYLSKLLGAKSVFTFHTDLRLGKLDAKNCFNWRISFVLNRIDELTSVSKFLSTQAIKAYGIKKPIKVIYNGVSKDFRNPEKSKRERNSILFVGNLFDIKDPLTFIEAIKILRDQGIKLNVKIIGTGYLESQIKEKIKEYKFGNTISLLDNIDHSEIPKHFSKSALYVCSSTGEGLGNTILEAISCGCRVVATSVGGVPEIGIDKHGCGVLVPAKNPTAMASAINSQLQSKSRINPNEILKKFNWDLAINEYINLYHDKEQKN